MNLYCQKLFLQMKKLIILSTEVLYQRKVKVDKELKFARELLEPVLEEIRKHDGVLSIMHVCRGNWTTDESVLLQGAYDKLGKFF